MSLAPYRKLIAAVVGILITILARHAGIDLTGTEELFVDLIVGGATAFAVWWFPNEAPPKVDDPEAMA